MKKLQERTKTQQKSLKYSHRHDFLEITSNGLPNSLVIIFGRDWKEEEAIGPSESVFLCFPKFPISSF